MTTGLAMRVKIELARLAQRHGVTMPAYRTEPPLPPCDGAMILSGFASVPCVDLERTKFHKYGLSWLHWTALSQAHSGRGRHHRYARMKGRHLGHHRSRPRSAPPPSASRRPATRSRTPMAARRSDSSVISSVFLVRTNASIKPVSSFALECLTG
jgi:hypothetical protein